MWKVGLLELPFALSTVQSIMNKLNDFRMVLISGRCKGADKNVIGSFVVDPTVVTSLSWSKVKVLYGTTSSMGSMRMHLKDYHQVWVYIPLAGLVQRNSMEVYLKLIGRAGASPPSRIYNRAEFSI